MAQKGDWDVGLAVDAIKMAPRLDTIIIVSGDGDFIPLVEYLQTMTQVEVIAFGQSTSGKLENKRMTFLIFQKIHGNILLVLKNNYVVWKIIL